MATARTANKSFICPASLPVPPALRSLSRHDPEGSSLVEAGTPVARRRNLLRESPNQSSPSGRTSGKAEMALAWLGLLPRNYTELRDSADRLLLLGLLHPEVASPRTAPIPIVSAREAAYSGGMFLAALSLPLA